MDQEILQARRRGDRRKEFHLLLKTLVAQKMETSPLINSPFAPTKYHRAVRYYFPMAKATICLLLEFVPQEVTNDLFWKLGYSRRKTMVFMMLRLGFNTGATLSPEEARILRSQRHASKEYILDQALRRLFELNNYQIREVVITHDNYKPINRKDRRIIAHYRGVALAQETNPIPKF